MGLRRPYQASTIIAYEAGSDLPMPFRTIASLETWADKHLKSGETLTYRERGANAGDAVYTVP